MYIMMYTASNMQSVDHTVDQRPIDIKYAGHIFKSTLHQNLVHDLFPPFH